MDLPLMVAPSDAVVSPTTAAVVDKLTVANPAHLAIRP